MPLHKRWNFFSVSVQCQQVGDNIRALFDLPQTPNNKQPNDIKALFNTTSCIPRPFRCPHKQIQFWLYTRYLNNYSWLNICLFKINVRTYNLHVHIQGELKVDFLKIYHIPTFNIHSTVLFLILFWNVYLHHTVVKISAVYGVLITYKKKWTLTNKSMENAL